MPDDAIDVLVCTTCRSTAPSDASPLAAEPEIRAGAQLYAALTQAPAPEGVTIRAVECLSNCNRGCTVALRGGNRWSYVYGNLDPHAHVETVLDGASRYRNAADGLVPWRERPEHFRKNCIARIPPLSLPETV
jgi:predicted metal-binding protein